MLPVSTRTLMPAPMSLRMASSGARPLPAATAALVVVLVAVAFTLSVAGSAHAHTALLESTPAEGAEVDAPAEVSLVFNQALIQLGNELTVTDAAGTVTALEPRFPEDHIVAATLPVLAAGAATVDWRVVSADGHPVEGVLTFVVNDPEPTVTPSATSEPTVTEGTPSPSPTVSVTVVPVAPEAGSGASAWAWWVVAAAVVAGGAAVVIRAVWRRE